MRCVVRLDLTYGDLFPATMYVCLLPDGRCEMTHRKDAASVMVGHEAELVADTMKKFFEAETKNNPNLKSYAVHVEPA